MAKGWHLCRAEGGCSTSVGPDVDFCGEHSPEVVDAPAPERRGGDPRALLRDLDAGLFADFAEGALTAERECKCGRSIPDWGARTNAARLALEHGWGRAQSAAEVSPDLSDDPSLWSPEERAKVAARVRDLLTRSEAA